MTKKLILLTFFFLIHCLIANAEERFPFVGEINEDSVNVRAGESTNFERLCQLNKNKEVVVVSKSYSWYKIRLPKEADCYISAKYVKPTFDNIGMVLGNRVNLRAGTLAKSSIIGKVGNGTRVRILSRDNGWYKIEPMEGSFGWVADNFVRFKSNQVPPPDIIIEPSRSIYPRNKPAVDMQAKEKPPVFSAIGRLEDLGRVVTTKQIRYKLVVDEKTAYYLIGPSLIFDQFINNNVSIQGEVRPDPEGFYEYPVIVVSNVNLVLSNHNL